MTEIKGHLFDNNEFLWVNYSLIHYFYIFKTIFITLLCHNVYKILFSLNNLLLRLVLVCINDSRMANA